MTLTITTFDTAPPFVHGFVRDLRIRWACEELGLPYDIDTVPFKPRSPEHTARQPWAKVPMLRDGDLSLFETGAMVLYIAEGQPALMPETRAERADVLQWAFAALNSVEPFTRAWVFARMFNRGEELIQVTFEDMHQCLKGLEPVLSDREWIAAGRFTAADILMSEVLRAVGESTDTAGDSQLAGYPALSAYVARATARPAFQKALADQLAHFAAKG